MTQLRISEAARLLGVSDDTVRRWAEAGRVESSTDTAGRRVVDARSLAAVAAAQPGPPTPGQVTGASARNRFVGIVTRVVADGVMAQVELQAGPFRVVSLLSSEAVAELGLEPGVVAVATVKATNVGVETLG